MIELESSMRIAAASWMLLIAAALWAARGGAPAAWLAALCLVGSIADRYFPLAHQTWASGRSRFVR